MECIIIEKSKRNCTFFERILNRYIAIYAIKTIQRNVDFVVMEDNSL